MATRKVKLKIKQRRSFSDEFKRSKVKELVEKRITIIELMKLYGVSRTAIYKWLYKYSVYHQQKTILVVQMESEAEKNKYFMQRLAELERIVGQKQLEIDFLNKLLEIGTEELGFDLKKNFSTKLSSGSDTSRESPDTK